MSFLFRRLSSRRRSNRGRRKSWPPGNQGPEAASNNNAGVGPDSGVHTQPQPSADTVAPPPYSSAIEDAYENRMDELGQMMQEQGRCIDALTNRSRRTSAENAMLRERLSESLASYRPVVAASPNRSPLKNIASNIQRSSRDGHAEHARKLKDENSLLVQQAELLADELANANKLIAERDTSIASFGKELSSCIEKARLLMMEKKTWKTDMFRKTKEVEILEADAKRSRTLQSEMSQRAEQYLAERKELEAEVADLGSQMSHLASKIEDLNIENTSKQGEIETTTDKLGEAEQASKSARQEAKHNAETARALQDSVRRAKSKNEQLHTKLRETRDLLDNSRISQHRLQTMNDNLQAEVKALVEKHKAHISSWTKGQKKIVATMKDQHLDEMQSQQRLVDNLRRANSSLERDSAQCKRELQSCQQRSSALEKQLAGRDSKHRDTLEEVLRRATQAETQWEASQTAERELKSMIAVLEEKLGLIRLESKGKEGQHSNTINRLQTELLSMREQNKALSTRIPYLEDEVEKTKQACAKEKQKMQQGTEQTIRDVNIECEALRVAKENERIKAREKEELLEKQSSLHRSTLDQMVAERDESALEMEKLISNEREVGKCLMQKVQELKSRIQTLTTEKFQLTNKLTNHADQIYTLEKIIASGEVKLSQFGKQLARSMDEQEQRIMKEVELKKELDGVRIELEKMKRRGGS